MKKTILIFSTLLVLSAIGHSQIVIGFGPHTVFENQENMNRLIQHSYVLPIYYKGTDISDSTLIHEVMLLNDESESYCVLYKTDTTKIAILVQKVKGQSGYRITDYWQNMNIKRYSEYGANYVYSGAWKEYFQNSEMSLQGTYKNGKKDGAWKYYDEKGNKILTEIYKDNVLIKAKKK